MPLLHGTFAFYRSYSFRNLPVSGIAGLEIKKVKGEFDPEKSAPVIFDDVQMIQRGLTALSDCKEITHNQSFENGYDVRLILQNGSNQNDYHLYFFKKNRKSGISDTAVIPYYGPTRSLNLGAYDCESFHNWIKQNVDPLFEKSPD